MKVNNYFLHPDRYDNCGIKAVDDFCLWKNFFFFFLKRSYEGVVLLHNAAD